MGNLKNQYSNFYSDLWSFLKKYINTQTDEEWDALHEDANILVDRYDDIDHQYACDMVNATRKMIQRRYVKRMEEAANE